MPIEQITDAITKIVHCPKESVVPEAELKNLGIDSLKAINILFELEEEFDIEIPNERIPEMTTVGDIVNCINELRNQQSS